MTPEPPRRRRVGVPGSTAGIAILAAIVAVAVVAAVIDPLGPSLHDPDAAASVLYFDRIVAGARLEAFVPTTPKPLLTLLYGATWAATGEWRLLGIWTLLAFAVGVAATAALLIRVAGRPAAAFAVTALVLSPFVAAEVAGANSLIWGFAGWALAGLAVSGEPRRPWIAGLALAAAATFRTETLVVVGLATVGIAVLVARSATARAPAGAGSAAPADPVRAWSGLLLGWLALPVAMVHDQLLTGDPFAWLRVPAGYTAVTTPDLRPTGPLEFAADVASRYAGEPLLVALGLIGIAWIVRRRQLALAAGLVALTAGILALIGFVAWRGIYVTSRYFEQADLGLIAAAGVAVGAIAGALPGVLGGRDGGSGGNGSAARRLPATIDDRWRATIGIVVAAGLAVVAAWPTSINDPLLAGRLATVRAESRHVATVVPVLRAALDRETRPVPPAIAGPGGLRVVDPANATLLVPRPLWTRLALELDAPLTRLADSWLAFRDGGPGTTLRPDQTVYHDAADSPAELYEPLEIDAPGILGQVRLVPVLVDAAGGIWVLAAEPAP